MNDPIFRYLQKQDFSVYAPKLFKIMHTNMNVIAPTENSYEDDFKSWCDSFGNAFINRSEWKTVLIELDNGIVGFFAYACSNDTFLMEEIQFSDGCKGKHGIFRKLYNYVTKDLPKDLLYVEAYAHKSNEKSIAILNRLGLICIGNNQSGNCYHFKGTYADYLSWLGNR